MGAPRGIGLNTIFTERNEDFLDRQLILVLDQRKKSRDYETVQVSEDCCQSDGNTSDATGARVKGPFCQFQDNCSIKISKVRDRLNVMETTP